MDSILRYFISGSNPDLLDLRNESADYALAGQQIFATGNSAVNIVHAALGVDLDATSLLGGEDVVIFNYRWDQYTKDTSSVSGAIVFTYLDADTGLSETVTVLNGALVMSRDKLVFADGAVLANNVREALSDNAEAAISDIPDYDAATTSGNYELPTSAGSTLRAFASTTKTDGTGAVFAKAEAGQTTLVTGTSKADEVYVKAGAIVDARNLLGGEDIIYFTGNWSDYTKSLTAKSGAIQFTRTVDSMTETVEVLNGVLSLGKDKLVFADGAVLTQNARTALQTDLDAGIADIEGYDVETVTPSPAPTTTLTSAAYDDSTGVLTVVGTNLDTLGVDNGTDVKAYLDWSKLAWDINGDDDTSADVTFSEEDITSAVVNTDNNTLTITLSESAKAALEAMEGFAAAGDADTLDVTAGFIRDTAGNAATTDALANGVISYSDGMAPTVESFSSTTPDGAYAAGSAINITATLSETVLAGTSFDVTLGTNETVTLTADSAGTTLSGSYTVGAGKTSSDLTVSSFTAGTVTDVNGYAISSTTLPAGNNLADNAAISIDSTAPTATLTSAAYNASTGVLTLTGTNLNTLGVSNGTDVKGYLDWSKLVWDINGDDDTTTDVVFTAEDIASAVVTNATTLTITLEATAKATLETTTGFAAAGSTDTLDVTAGFIKDTAGNAAATDTLADGAISYSDTTAPTVVSFSSTTDNGAYKVGGTINITATLSETVQAGSTFEVTLDTNDTVILTADAASTTLSGSYTVAEGKASSDLTVSSFTAGTVTDLYGNQLSSTTLPAGNNLANNAAISIDSTAPTTTLTSAAYNGSTGVLTLTGTNLNTLGVSNGTDVKTYLDWSKLVWDINGDNDTSTDVAFAAEDIASAVVTNATTLTITLEAAAKAVLEGTTGFAASGGADKVDVTAGFIRDTAGNAATTDALTDGAITYSDTSAPTVLSFDSTTSDGAYKAGSAINITATLSETVQAGSTFEVTLDTNDEVTLTADAAGTTLSGSYTVAEGKASSDLTVSSFTAGTVTDLYGNVMSSTTLPAGNNLANNAAISVDSTAPTATLTSAAYNGSTGVLTLTGTNLGTLGVSNGTDVKTYLDWSKLVWDINGDNDTTTDVAFAAEDIASAVVTNATTLTITLEATAKAALEATTGFAASGGADKVDVTAGFIKDTAGNVASTDALANGAISYSDTTAPSAATTAPTAEAGPYINATESGVGFTVLASLEGTNAVAGDVLELKLGGSSFSTPLTRKLTSEDISTGSYSFTVPADSLGADGAKSLTVVVTDVFGNVGVASQALALTLDSAAPSAASAAPTVAIGSTIDAAEANAGFSVVASLAGSNAAAGDSIELKLNGNSFSSPLTHTLTTNDIIAGSYNFSVTGSALGNDGTKVLSSVLTDVAGNIGAASPDLTLTLNTTTSRAIAYSTTTFVEAAANNGSISSEATLTLTGGTFAGADSELINGVTFSNVPSGLTARLVKTSDTTATLELTGKASAHANTNDIANLTVNLGNAAFTSGNAGNVTGATRDDLVIDFASPGLIFSGGLGTDFLSGTSGDDIIYGNGGADVITAGAGSDTIDITDATTSAAGSVTIVMTDENAGLDTLIGFMGGGVDSGGDVLDFNAIAGLTDSVATGLSAASDFDADNLFVFNDTAISIEEAAAAIASDESVTATQGYIVIADSANNGDTTIYHSSDLAQNGIETAMLKLEGVDISTLTAVNFVI